jgi:hypothetical protein
MGLVPWEPKQKYPPTAASNPSNGRQGKACPRMTLRSSMLRQERKPLAAFKDANLFCRRIGQTEDKSRTP